MYGGTSATGGTTTRRTSLCDIGLTQCATDAGVACVDVQGDASNCGYCGHACQSGWHCFASECRAPACTATFGFGPVAFDAGYDGSANLASMVAGDFNQDGLLDLAATDDANAVVGVRLGVKSGELGPAAFYATGSYPQNLATADLNGDGKLDLAIVNSSYGLSVLLGNGDGTFANNRDIATANQLYQVVIGDLNGDNKPDLVADASQGRGVQVFIGNGDGTFAAPVAYSASGSLNSLVLADLNGDAHPDVIGANSATASLTVWLGKADGTLAPATDYAIGTDYPATLAVGDVNNDGKVDVVVPGQYPNTVTVMLGDGKGALNPSLAYTTGGSSTVMLGDLNRDSKLDIVLLEPDSTGSAGNLGVRLGLGTGAFGPEVLYPFDRGATSPVIGDFDDDGLLDVAALDPPNGTMIILPGNGDGTFVGAISYPNMGCTLGLGDANRDGVLDLFAVTSSAAVDVYFGPLQHAQNPSESYAIEYGPSQITVSDVDGDGLLDYVIHPPGGSPISVFFGSAGGTFGDRVDIATNGTQSVAVADVDHDGFNDILSLSSGYPYAVDVFLQQSQRTFAGSQSYGLGYSTLNFAVGDLNGDHLPDLVTSAYSNYGYPLALNVALGKGAGVFSTAVEYEQGYSWSESINLIRLADMNGDGKLDVVLGGANSNFIRVILGQGDGTLGDGQNYSFGDPNYTSGAQGLVVDDINGDGHLDVVAVGLSGSVNVLFGAGDGTLANALVVGYAPVSSASWYGEPLVSGDLNGDGWPDLAVADTSACNVNVLFGRCR